MKYRFNVFIFRKGNCSRFEFNSLSASLDRIRYLFGMEGDLIDRAVLVDLGEHITKIFYYGDKIERSVQSNS